VIDVSRLGTCDSPAAQILLAIGRFKAKLPRSARRQRQKVLAIHDMRVINWRTTI